MKDAAGWLTHLSHATQKHLPWEWCCPRWAKPSYKNWQPIRSLGRHTPFRFRKLPSGQLNQPGHQKANFATLQSNSFQKCHLLRFSTPWKRLSVTALSVYGISPQGRLCYVVAISFVVLGLDRAPIARCLETASWCSVQDGLELTIILPLPPPESGITSTSNIHGFPQRLFRWPLCITWGCMLKCHFQ